MRIPLLALLLLGCATAAGDRPLPELTAWQPPPGQTCTIGGDDFPLAALVDSAAVAAAIRALAPADGGLLLSVSTDSTGARSRFRPIETTWPEPVAGAVMDALDPLVGAPATGPLAGRLLLETVAGGLARLEVGPSQFCRPALANRRTLQVALQDLYRDRRREGSVNVWLYVDTDGTVTKGHVNKGTGDIAFDGAALAVGKTGRFHPARIDRAPVPVYVALDLTVEFATTCPPGDSAIFAPGSPDPCRRIPPRRRR